MTGTITEQLGLAYDPAQPRDGSGRWKADLSRAAEHNADVEVHLYGREADGEKHAVLSLIRTAAKSRGQGMADDTMKRITRAADRHGVAMHLTPEPLAGDRVTKKSQLARWYGRHGFEPNTGSGRDLRFSDTMVRYPRGEPTELAHDAWKHEMRDDHGRWTRTPGESVPAEGYIGHNRDSILAEWRDASDPGIKQHLNLAEAYLDEKPITAAFHIREAARIARKNGDAGKASDLQILAARITGDDERRESGQKAAQDFTAKAATAVPGLLGGGKSGWNGKVDVFPPGQYDRPDFHTLALIDWDGKISMDEGEAAKIRDALDNPGKPVADPAVFSVALHELIHGTIGGQTAGDAAAWGKLNAWDQAAIEAFHALDKHNASAGANPTLHSAGDAAKAGAIFQDTIDDLEKRGLLVKGSGGGTYSASGTYTEDPPKWMLTARAQAMIPPEEPYKAHQRAYQDKRNADIEEGFTELGTVHHMPEFAERMGIGGRETNFTTDVMPGKPDKRQLAQAAAQIEGIKSFDLPIQVNQRLDSAIAALNSGDTDSAVSYISQAALRIKDPAAHKRLMDVAQAASLISEEPRHATMSEYARRLQDPQRVEDGGAWGHYGWQTAAAQRWVRAIAKAEGRKPGGQPFQRRVVELSDEINREGAAGKVPAMVRQAMRAAKAADTYTDAGLLSDMMADGIRKHWETGNQRAGSDAAGQVLADAKRHGRSGS